MCICEVGLQVYYSELYHEIDHTDLNKNIFIVFLYEHIVHTGSGVCMKKYTVQLGLPVYCSKFGCRQIAHTASVVVWVDSSYHSLEREMKHRASDHRRQKGCYIWNASDHIACYCPEGRCFQ